MLLETSIESNSEVVKNLQTQVTTVDVTQLAAGVTEALGRTYQTFERNVTFVGESGTAETVEGLTDKEGRLKQFFELNTEHIRSFLVDKVAAKLADKTAEATSIINFLLDGTPPNMAQIMLGQAGQINFSNADNTESDAVAIEGEGGELQEEVIEGEEVVTAKDNEGVVEGFFDQNAHEPIKVGGLGKKNKEKFRSEMTGMIVSQAEKLGIVLTEAKMTALQNKLIEAGAVKNNGKWPKRRAQKIEIATYHALIELSGNEALKTERKALNTFFAGEKTVMMHQYGKQLLPILIHLVAREEGKIFDEAFLKALKKYFIDNGYLKRDKKWQFDGSADEFRAKVKVFCAQYPPAVA